MTDPISWVEVLGITMSGAVAPDAGFVWSNLEGWWGLPDARGDADVIPGGHGRYRRTRVLREARALTLTGWIVCGDYLSLVSARDRLEAALAYGVGSMRVASRSGIWERDVEVEAAQVEPDRGRSRVQFTIDMVAPDPRRYGPTQTVGPVGLSAKSGGLRLPKRLPWNLGASSGGESLRLTNAGQIDVHPVLRVTGGGTSRLSVRDITSGSRLDLVYPVLPGVEVRFDSAARRVWAGEQDVSMHLESRQWFTIPAGQTHEFRFEASGGAEPQLWADYRIGAW